MHIDNTRSIISAQQSPLPHLHIPSILHSVRGGTTFWHELIATCLGSSLSTSVPGVIVAGVTIQEICHTGAGVLFLFMDE